MKKCYTARIKPKEVNEVLDKGFKSIIDNPKSIELFKNADKEYIKKFIRAIAKGELSDYFLMCFKDSTDNHIVGACLMSCGNPWYNPKLLVANEECTISFERGYGITRKIAEELLNVLNKGIADVVMASSANDCVAKLIENTYTKYNFKQYKTYYKTK